MIVIGANMSRISGNGGSFLIKSCPADAKGVCIDKLDAAVFCAFWIETDAIQTTQQLIAVWRAGVKEPAIGNGQGDFSVGSALLSQRVCGLQRETAQCRLLSSFGFIVRHRIIGFLFAAGCVI